MTFFRNFINNLKKKDSILAFMLSSILFYLFTLNLLKSFLFSIIFVIVFLILLNFIK